MSPTDTGAPVRAPLHLAVALDGAGHHPAVAGPVPARTDLVRTAERGLLDLVTFGPASDPARWCDAHLDASAAAPVTGRIGLVASVTHPGPLRTAAALSAVDRDSAGRAGWWLRTPATADDDARPGVPGPWRGRLVTPGARERFTDRLDDAAETVGIVRRLWESWTGGARLHHVDFHSDRSAGRAPSLVPPPPQGALPVLVSGTGWKTVLLAARVADAVLTTPVDAFGAAAVVEQVRDAERAAGRTGAPLRVLADVVVLLEDTDVAARERLERLDEVEWLCSDAAVIATTPAGLADVLLAWQVSGLDGYRLLPARLPVDLDRIVDGLVPELQRRGAFRTRYAGSTLREHLGLAPVSRADREPLPGAAPAAS